MLLFYVGMRVLEPLGSGHPDAQLGMRLGLSLLAALAAGQVVKAARVPVVLGYLLAGVILGPSGLDELTAPTLHALAPLETLAIACIAFQAGSELRWDVFSARAGALLKLLSSELALAFIAVAATVYLGRGAIPALRGGAPNESIAFGMLFAAAAVVHSPLATMAVLEETGARGPVARTTLDIVLLADVVVALLVSAAVVAAGAITGGVADVGGSVAALGRLLIVSLAMGTAVGAAGAIARRSVPSRQGVALALVVVASGVTLARLLHAAPVLTLISAGFTMANARRTPGDEPAFVDARVATASYVVLFALVGAGIDPRGIIAAFPLLLAVVLVRMAAIWLGVQVGGRWAGVSTPERRFAWMGLVSQSGLAIGFTLAVSDTGWPQAGQLVGLLLSLITLNELAGPVLFRIALARSDLVPSRPSLERALLTQPARG